MPELSVDMGMLIVTPPPPPIQLKKKKYLTYNFVLLRMCKLWRQDMVLCACINLTKNKKKQQKQQNKTTKKHTPKPPKNNNPKTNKQT